MCFQLLRYMFFISSSQVSCKLNANYGSSRALSFIENYWKPSLQASLGFGLVQHKTTVEK